MNNQRKGEQKKNVLKDICQKLFICFYIDLSRINLAELGQGPWSPEADISNTSCCKIHSRFYCCYGYSNLLFNRREINSPRSLQHIITQPSRCQALHTGVGFSNITLNLNIKSREGGRKGPDGFLAAQLILYQGVFTSACHVQRAVLCSVFTPMI